MKRKADWSSDPKFQNENQSKDNKNDNIFDNNDSQLNSDDKPKISAKRITQQTKDLDINFNDNNEENNKDQNLNNENIIPNSLFSSNNNNLINKNNSNNSQSITKPLFSDNNLSKPLFGNGSQSNSNNLFNNKSTSLFTTTNGDNSNPNPFKAFNTGNANPFASTNPFLGSNPAAKGLNQRDNTSQDNKSFGDFFKQGQGNNNKEDEEEDDGDDNPEQENEWTRNMNPDLKQTAKSSIKSTKDQLDYKNEYVCVTKCQALKYKTRNEQNEIVKLGNGVMTVEILPDPYNILFVQRLKGNLIVSIMGQFNDKCICKKSNIKEGKAYQLLNIYEIDKKKQTKLFVKFENDVQRQEFENRMSDARTAAAKFKSNEQNYDDYKGKQIDEKISQAEEQNIESTNDANQEKE